MRLVNTLKPVELDAWYEHTDGTFGFYVGAARFNGPKKVKHANTAEECVDRDEHGKLINVGWPARSAYGVYDEFGVWTQTREIDDRPRGEHG